MTSTHKMCGDNGDHFIATLNNVLLAPYLCGKLFSLITLIILGYTCLSHKGVFIVYFGVKEKNVVTLLHIAQRNHACMGKIKEMSKTK